MQALDFMVQLPRLERGTPRSTIRPEASNFSGGWQKLVRSGALILALAATPLHAGGPVIVEDMTESAPIVQSKRDKTALILLGLALAAIIASGGSDNCNGDETPAPQPGPCP